MRDHLSLEQLGVSLGVAYKHSGTSTDAAMERVADLWIDHPFSTWAMLLDTIKRRKNPGERLSYDERMKRAFGRKQASEIIEQLIQDDEDRLEGRANLPHAMAARQAR